MSARGLVLGAGLAGVIACGAAQKSAAPVAPGSTDAGGRPAAGGPHDEIEALANEIDAKLGAAHIAPPVSPMTMGVSATAMPVAPKHTDPACHPGPSDTCTDSCKLSDDICDDAKRICDLATNQLAGDDWAAGKCNSAKQSCDTAHATCCGCR